MALMIAVSVLLVLQMFLMHLDKLVKAYYFLYKLAFKPKFVVGEFVMINDVEYEVVLLLKNSKPYTYLCLPINNTTYSGMYNTYFHESEICKKTGLLKELE